MNGSLRRYWRPLRLSNGEAKTLKIVLAACVLVIAAVIVAAVFSLGTAKELINDPSEVDSVNYPAYFGAVSYLGVLGWAVGAALSLFAAGIAAPGTPARRFLGMAGALSALLGADDLFRFHEHVGFLTPRGEHFTLMAYSGLIALVVWHNRRFMLESTPVVIAGVAGMLLAGSAVIDLAPVHPRVAFLPEDGLKFVGITFWALYLGIVARRACIAATTRRESPFAAADGGRKSSPPVLIEV